MKEAIVLLAGCLIGAALIFIEIQDRKVEALEERVEMCAVKGGVWCAMTRPLNDPLTNPQPGDVVIYGPQWQRERVEVIGANDRDIDCRLENGSVTYFTRWQWSRFMVGAEVLNVAQQ